VVEGARKASPQKEQFWKNLYKALYAKLERAFRELLEDDTQDVPLKKILNECISQARTETSPQTSDSESREDFPICPQNIDDLSDFGSLSNFAGVDLEDAEVSVSDQAFQPTTDLLSLEFVPGQPVRHVRRIPNDPPSANLGVGANLAPGQLSDLQTLIPMLSPIPDFNAMQENPSSLSKEESSEWGNVPPITDPTYFTLFDSATSSAPENNFDFANEPFDAWPLGQQDVGPSDHLNGGDDAELNFWPDLPW
jgi:hypothetical protein